MKLTKIGVLCAEIFCLFTFCLNIYAYPGDLDTSFSGDGKTTTSFGDDDYVRNVAIQPDGKIVVVGFTDDGMNPPNIDLALARYNTDGSLDTDFGTGGKISIPESGIQTASGLIIQQDGKILAIGSHLYNLAVYRFNSNGSLDTTFGTNGRIVHIIGLESEAVDGVLQPDGKIVLAGFVRFNSEPIKLSVFRLNPDGSLDTTFNSIGYTAVPSSGTYARSIALQTDGKIIVGGLHWSETNGYWERFSSDGILEGGNLIRSDVQINDLAIQANGKLVFAGTVRTINTGITNVAVTRFNADKTLDVHFGNGGVNTVNWGTGNTNPNYGMSLLIQPSGRIIVGGSANFGFFDFGIAAFNTHGLPDRGFGNNGIVTTQIGSTQDELYALAQQTDGKIVTVGHSGNDTYDGIDFAVARYEAGDSNALSNRTQFDYDGDGRADISVFRPSTGVWYILKSSDSSFDIRTFGISGDIPAPADFDGDARTDIGIYRNGNWWYSLSSGVSGNAQLFPWQVTGIPRPGDFNGDGLADIVAYQSSVNVWSRFDSVTTQTSNLIFGSAGDKPILGDFDGDSKTDPAIYRPSTGEWWYLSSINGAQLATRWGVSTDIPVAADYDGDGKTDFAVYRPSEGVWYIYNSSTGSPTIMKFGLAEDIPVAADYDGDGKADIAVFRPSTGIWFLMRSTAGFTALQFGISSDIPTPYAFIP